MLQHRKPVLREFPEDPKNSQKSEKLDKCGKVQILFSQRKGKMRTISAILKAVPQRKGILGYG